MANDPEPSGLRGQTLMTPFGPTGTSTNGLSFQDGGTFGSKYDEGLKSSLLKKEAPKAAYPKKYTVKPLSDDEWKALTATQQRAVAGNQLMYQASVDENARGSIHSFLGYNDKNPAPSMANFATMEDIRYLDGNSPDASQTAGRGIRYLDGNSPDASQTAGRGIRALPDGKTKTHTWIAEVAPDAISPDRLDTLSNLASLVEQYGKAVPDNRPGRPAASRVESLLTVGDTSVGQYVGRKTLSIADETQKLDPLIQNIAGSDWGLATPDDIKFLEEQIRSTTEGMPLDQALAYMRKRFTKLGEENEDFDPQPIIQFLNIGGSNGG